jgi:hypothetical protein
MAYSSPSQSEHPGLLSSVSLLWHLLFSKVLLGSIPRECLTTWVLQISLRCHDVYSCIPSVDEHPIDKCVRDSFSYPYPLR